MARVSPTAIVSRRSGYIGGRYTGEQMSGRRFTKDATDSRNGSFCDPTLGRRRRLGLDGVVRFHYELSRRHRVIYCAPSEREYSE